MALRVQGYHLNPKIMKRLATFPDISRPSRGYMQFEWTHEQRFRSNNGRLIARVRPLRHERQGKARAMEREEPQWSEDSF